MTTNFDTDPYTQTVAAASSPNTQTVAAAWSSSPLGQPESEVRFGFPMTGPTESVIPDEPQPSAKRAARCGAGVRRHRGRRAGRDAVRLHQLRAAHCRGSQVGKRVARANEGSSD